jgi:hypothetical protein
MGRDYRPRWAATIYLSGIYNDTEAVELPLLVRQAEWTHNDHMRADELVIVVDVADIGLDPRMFENGIVYFYVGNADDKGAWEPSERNMRFIGRVTRAKRVGPAEGDHTIEFHCLDYTSFFLLTKPVAAVAMPKLTMTLLDAWKLLCEHVPGAETLSTNVVFDGVPSPGPKLGEGTSSRFLTAGANLVPVSPDADAWAIWQQCVGMLGLVSYFELDHVVVTTSTNYFGDDERPTFVRGRDILSFEEERNNDFERVGVGVQCFDPIRRHLIEAVYPPAGDKRLKTRRVSPGSGGNVHAGALAGPEAAKKRKTNSKATPKLAEDESKRIWFQVENVTDMKHLLRVATVAYNNLSVQSFQGQMTTAEMIGTTQTGAPRDLLDLKCGSSIIVRVDELDEDLALIGQQAGGESYIKQRLLQLGYQPALATLVAKNAVKAASLRAEFYLKQLRVTMETDDSNGTFELELQYMNKIRITSDAEVGEVE